jgi:hypothetical protein
MIYLEFVSKNTGDAMPKVTTLTLTYTTFKILLASSLLAAWAVPAAASTYIGNTFDFSAPNLNPDGDPPFVILGEYDSSGPLSGPASVTSFPTSGQVEDVTFYGDSYNFTLYALAWVSGANNEQTFRVDASEQFSGTSPTAVQTLPVTNFFVNSGDLLAFAGIGPYYPFPVRVDEHGTDATYASGGDPFTATPPSGVIGTTLTVGVNGDPLSDYYYVDDCCAQGRIYYIGVDVATPEPGTFTFVLAGCFGILSVIRLRRLRA